MAVLENLMMVPPGQTGENVLTSRFRWGKVESQGRTIRRQAEAVLAFLALDHPRGVPAGSRSGGQKKLLALGRTIMTDALEE